MRLRRRLREWIDSWFTIPEAKPYEPRACQRCGLLFDALFTPVPSETMPEMPPPKFDMCSNCVRELDEDLEEERKKENAFEQYERENVLHIDLFVAEREEADPHSLHALMHAAARVAYARGWPFDKFQEETGAYFLTIEAEDVPLPPEVPT